MTEPDPLHGGVFEGYRTFMAEGDGARFRQYNEIDGPFHSGLREVFAAAADSDGTDRTLPAVLEAYDDRVPADFLPVADDAGGNLICIGISGPHAGAVYFWDHDMEAEEDEEPTMENMEPLAGSFDELLDRVRIV